MLEPSRPVGAHLPHPAVGVVRWRANIRSGEASLSRYSSWLAAQTWTRISGHIHVILVHVRRDAQT
jgi:hypothetical protein